MSGETAVTETATNEDAVASTEPQRRVPVLIEDISENPYQPRSKKPTEEEIQDMMERLSKDGQLNAVILRKTLVGYDLVDGECRWIAAQRLGWNYLDGDIRILDDKQAMELSLVANMARRALAQIDEAFAYRRLVDEFGSTPQEIAVRVGKSITGVEDALRLTKLPLEVIDAIRDGALNYSHGLALNPLREIEHEGVSQAVLYAHKAIDGKWTATALDEEVRAFLENQREEEERLKEQQQPRLNADEETDESSPTPETTEPAVEEPVSAQPESNAEEATAVVKTAPAEAPDTSTPLPLLIDEQVQWRKAKGGKFSTGKVVEITPVFVWVEAHVGAKRRNFKIEEAHTVLQRINGIPIKPFETKRKSASTQTKPAEPPKPAPAPAASAAPAPLKAPDGFMSTFVPKDDCFYCQDNGLTMQDVFGIARQLIDWGKPLGLVPADLMTTLASTLGVAEETPESDAPATEEKADDELQEGAEVIPHDEAIVAP